VVCLLAVGFVWSICAPNAPVAKAAWSPASDLREGSRAQTDSSASVEAVRRILADDSGKSDAEVAKQLSGLVLTERISDQTIPLLEQNLPGKKSLWALMALADASAFLAPPAADVLSQAPPDLSEQRRMMALTVDYLGKTLPKLPDFYATRTTIRFDGDVNLPRIGLHRRAASQEDSSWRRVGSSEAIVVYRVGKRWSILSIGENILRVRRVEA
jgi:hypothetical protein